MELPCVHKVNSPHVAGLHHIKFSPCCHKADAVADLHFAVGDAHIDDNALVWVVDAVKDECFKRCIRITLGGGDVRHNTLQHRTDVLTCLGGYAGGIQCRYADDVLYLVAHTLRVCRGQVYLVDDRHYLQIMLQCKIGVGKGLGLYALGGIHYEYSALTGGKGAGDLIVEVYVPRCVYKVEHVFLSVVCGIEEPHCSCLYGYAPLPLNVHVVKELILHVTQCHSLCKLQYPVGKGGFAVIYMGYDTKIPDIAFIHFHAPSLYYSKAILLFYHIPGEKSTGQ